MAAVSRGGGQRSVLRFGVMTVTRGTDMPYKLTWLVENRVLYVRYFGVFTREDLENSLAESVAMRDQANVVNGDDGPLVHTVSDVLRMEGQTVGLTDAQQTLRALRGQRAGWSVYVSDNRAQRFMSAVGHQLAGMRFRSFNNLPAALAFLQEADPTLPALKPPPEL